MQRILVTGNAGSGKSTLSRRLATILDLPVVHLDKIIWEPGWRTVPKEAVALRLEESLSEPTWIFDGVCTPAFLAADTIIFLDLPLGTCLLRAWLRIFRHLFSPLAEVRAQCPRAKIAWAMTKIIFRFYGATRPVILEMLEKSKHSKRVFHVQNQRGLENFLKVASRERRVPE